MKKLMDLGERSWESVCEAMGWELSIRAEQVSVADWVALARLLDPNPLKDNPQRADELFDVVDENNAVVRQEKRGIVHAEGLRHRAMHLFALQQAWRSVFAEALGVERFVSGFVGFECGRALRCR